MSADMPDARASRKRQIQITPKLFTAAAPRLCSSRAAHVLHRALKRIFSWLCCPGKRPGAAEDPRPPGGLAVPLTNRVEIA